MKKYKVQGSLSRLDLDIREIVTASEGADGGTRAWTFALSKRKVEMSIPEESMVWVGVRIFDF